MPNAVESNPNEVRDQRQSARLPIKCRARIQIGNRHYSGYVENISEGGAKLTTFTLIRPTGNVVLRLPDLPLLKGKLRWVNGTFAGMAFCLTLSPEQLSEWVGNRCTEFLPIPIRGIPGDPRHCQLSRFD